LRKSQNAAALRYPVRFSVVLRHLGELTLVLGFLSLVPFAVSMLCGDYGIGLRYLLVAAGLFSFGLGLSKLPVTERIQTNEAMSITALAFLIAPLVMTYPMMGSGIHFLDAFFEAVSAVTTTGLSTTATLKGKLPSFLFARAWMQWYGGLGMVVLALAILIKPGPTARHLGHMGDYEGDLIGATRAHARYIMRVYGVLTVAGFLLLLVFGIDWWNAVLYTFTAVSTGGFSPHDASLAALNGVGKQAAVILLSMTGAVSFIFYRRQFLKGPRAVLQERQTQCFLIAAMVSAGLIVAFLRFHHGFQWGPAVHHGILNAFSAQSTVGFSSMDISQMDAGAKLVLMASMISGGCIGSTAGGIKILRLIVLVRLLHLIVLKTALPRTAATDIKLEGRRLQSEDIHIALGIILLFIICAGLSWFAFLTMGYDPINSLFEVVSALGTVGLSTGIAAPDLHPLLKGVLCADMLLGRLEILAWLVLLTPRNWIGKRWEG